MRLRFKKPRVLRVMGLLILSLLVFSVTRHSNKTPRSFRQSEALNLAESWSNLTYGYMRNSKSIPRIIHQTWKSLSENELTSHPTLKRSVASFRSQNPEYLYIFWSDEDVDIFVEKYFPEKFEFFKRIPLPVLKSDLFRYLVVYVFGGIYADVDIDCDQPAETWIPSSNHAQDVYAVLSNENDFSDTDEWWTVVPRQFQWLQWAFVFAPKHPILELIIEESIQRMKSVGLETIRKRKGPVMDLTGPAIWTDIINFYLDAQYGFNWRDLRGFTDPKLIGNILLYPQYGFSPRTEEAKKRSLLTHNFAGTWKKDGSY